MLKRKRYKAKFLRVIPDPTFGDQYEWQIFDQHGIFLGRYRADTEAFWATVNPTAPRPPDLKL